MPEFFRSPSALRAWLTKHHATARELLVGLHRKGSGKPSMTWPESVDEALACGWIDGVRRRFDDDSYTIRFTPRRPRSIWSTVNIRRAGELAAEGRIYAYEQRSDTLLAPYAARMRKHKAAWAFFQAQPPSYRKKLGWWVVSAKKEETRLKRLDLLIDASADGRRR